MDYFGRAQKAKKEYEISNVKERIQMSIIELQIEKASKNESSPSIESDLLPKLYEEGIIIADYGVEKGENGEESVEVITEKGLVIKITKNIDGSFEIEYKKDIDKNVKNAPEPIIELEIENEEPNQIFVTIKVSVREEKYGIKKIQLIDSKTGKVTTTLTYEKGTKSVEDVKFTVSENGEYIVKVISNAPKVGSKRIEVRNILEVLTIIPSETEWTKEDITLEVIWPENVKENSKQISLDETEEEKYVIYIGNEKVVKNQVVYVRCQKENDDKYITGNINIENIDKLAPKEFNQTVIAKIGEIKIGAKTEDREETEEFGKSEIEQYMYKIDNEEWISKGLETEYTIEVEAGKHKITTKAVDKAKNETIATNREEEVIVKGLEEYENEITITLTPEEEKYAKEKKLDVIWPTELENVTGIIKQISIDGGRTYSEYNGSVVIKNNCVAYAQVVYGEKTITAVLNIESIDSEGPEVEQTFNKEKMKLTVKVKDEKSGLKSIKIEKITSETSTSEKVYTQVGEIHIYNKEQKEQIIEETVRATYQKYLRGYKITAIDECENENIVEIINLSILNDEIIIYTAEELKEFADTVNSGTTYLGITVQLGADIDLSELKDNTGNQADWEPVGNSQDKAFRGNFDGNGYTISNMKITNIMNADATNNYIGLFGYLDSGGEISNLILKDYNINISFNVNRLGALVGYSKGEISNIATIGNITLKKNTGDYVGGVAGQQSGGTIEKVYTEGNIQCECYYAGGVVGRSNGKVIDSFSSVNISDLSNSRTISSAFGIAGYEAKIHNCYYIGNINTLEKNAKIGTGANLRVSNSYYVGSEDYEEKNTKGTSVLLSFLTHKDSFEENGYKWDFEKIWQIDEGKSLPYLRGLPKPQIVTDILNEYDIINGTGREGNPYQIGTAKQLDEIRCAKEASYILVKDIDLSELKDNTGNQADWIPVGSSANKAFKGNFDGNGHIISNMKITNILNDDTGNDYTGLFGYLGSGGEISNLILKDYNIVISKYAHYLGALVGYSKGEISNIATIGNITFKKITGYNVGGVVGFYDEGTIEKAYSEGIMQCKYFYKAGGIVGDTNGSQKVKILNSYSKVNISKADYAGGISGGAGSITNCYYAGNLTGETKSGGIVPSTGVVSNSYWCNEMISETTSNLGTGLNKEQMKEISSYSGWDISSDESANTIWVIRAGEFPKLRWMK